ncbi:MAG: hypothetical protein QOE61_2578, partial [Micromonosporaceae bacterium]|nr:hypothetical protein [Micromonosporaceae bacterium]
MPFLSVIIPVYGVHGYLRECLDSILEQSFGDIEVIAVDDDSPDHCPRILDEYAERDPRLRVIHIDHNVGNGYARNAGLDQATGAYVWFVDSDDWLPPGALQAVAAALRASEPEVLLVDHSRVDLLGEHTPGHGAPLPGRGDATVMTVVDEPALLSVFAVPWNKILRRDFLRRTGIRFDAGWYEDVSFTYPVLVTAERIATLHRVCYHYRRRRDGITQTRSVQHYDVFDQWSRVFDRLDQLTRDGDGAAERVAAVRDEIFHRMVRHLLVVQVMPQRLPTDNRRAFFHQMSQHYHRYRPPGFAVPGDRRDRLRHRLVAADAYRRFQRVHMAQLLAGNGQRASAAIGRRLRLMAGTVLRWVRAAAGMAV